MLPVQIYYCQAECDYGTIQDIDEEDMEKVRKRPIERKK